MQLTAELKLFPTIEQTILLCETTCEYIDTINTLLDYFSGQIDVPRMSSKDIYAELPSVLRCQCIQDARSIYKKATSYKYRGTFPVLKKRMAIWNNQSYKITDEHTVKIPMLMDGKTSRVSIKAQSSSRIWELLKSSKLGTLRITVKNGK